jgi:anaerobic selenocysteine-containing dehydrogenase
MPNHSDDMFQLRSGLWSGRRGGKGYQYNRRFEGNPEHPGSRGRNCAKGPATLNQVNDPERIRCPLKRVGKRGEGKWERVSWDEVLDDIAGRVRKGAAR